tara:strand:- start:122 stop:373 length:252 start_codon:yes stop_codon:yes gene_type:complete
MPNNKIYYNDLSIEDMFKQRDWTSAYSDDHRAWENGVAQQKCIQEKIEELGGWSQELVSIHNKYCPKPMQISEEWIKNYLLKQ